MTTIILVITAPRRVTMIAKQPESKFNSVSWSGGRAIVKANSKRSKWKVRTAIKVQRNPKNVDLTSCVSPDAGFTSPD